MSPKESLQAILSKQYESEDGEAFQAEPLDGLTDVEIDQLKSHLPGQRLPAELEALLRFSKGFEFDFLEEVRFDAFGHFGFEEMFPYSVQLAGDGLGNF